MSVDYEITTYNPVPDAPVIEVKIVKRYHDSQLGPDTITRRFPTSEEALQIIQRERAIQIGKGTIGWGMKIFGPLISAVNLYTAYTAGMENANPLYIVGGIAAAGVGQLLANDAGNKLQMLDPMISRFTVKRGHQ